MGESVPQSQEPLAALIHERIEEAGGIPFCDYMGLCLYHPEYGYYTSRRERIGKGGDFFTSSSVHAIFGRLISRQLEQMWQLLGKGVFTIAEQGAGEGHLALDILDALAQESPEFYARLSYRIVELSADNRARQAAQLARHVEAGRVSWCQEADLDGMEGCLLSNELVDAFPVHLVEATQGGLKEVYVVNKEGGGFCEELRELSDPQIEKHLLSLDVKMAPGYRTEVNLEAGRWISRVAGLLKRGFLLTVDYGYPTSDYYAPHRHNGTLMCFYRHQGSENPYQHVGSQDITAHIDFTALEQAGRRAGLAPLYFGEQYRFLMGLGFIEELMVLQAKETDPKKAQALRVTLKNLILPEGGMGDTFKVLVQGKNVGEPQLLCQRSIGEIALPGMG